MRRLNIFVDETGEFGFGKNASELYGISFTFHEHNNDITKEIAILNDINIHLDECPYSHLSLRAKIKEFLNNNEDIYPGIKNNIMESFQKILTFESDIPSNLNECRLCGEPTSSDICKACELKKLISENHESHI